MPASWLERVVPSVSECVRQCGVGVAGAGCGPTLLCHGNGLPIHVESPTRPKTVGRPLCVMPKEESNVDVEFPIPH